jgi:glyoxylase-like metal-dependent hydrolase (beta-lactamase superfamily II)
VLTHYHSDHAGLIVPLVKASGCEVLGHPAIEHFTDATLRPEDIEAARGERARAEGVPEAMVPACADVSEEVYGIVGAAPPDRALHEGDTFASALGDWTAIESPGHAPSHLCLHQRDSGTLIVGDLLAPAFYPYFDYGYTPDPVGEYFLSLERMEDLEGVTLVLPGHGRPLPDLREAVTNWRAQMRTRIDAVEAEVAAGATNGWEITCRLYDVEAHGAMASMDLAEVIAYLRHLRRMGRVVRKTLPDGTFRYSMG